MIRLFAAVELPDVVRQRLLMLETGMPGARWQRDDQLHLTLKFFGEVEEPVAEDIRVALGAIRAAPFDLTLGGVGRFGKANHPRMLWAGVDGADHLVHIHEKIEAAGKRIGIRAEDRRFKPHVTLARLRGVDPHRVQDFLVAGDGFRAPTFAVSHFTLYQSLMGRGGSVYTVIERYPLDGVFSAAEALDDAHDRPDI